MSERAPRAARSLLALCVASWLGCGPPNAPLADARQSEACATAIESAADAWTSVHTLALERAEPPPPAEENRLTLAALERLEAHIASLRAAPREIEGEEAMALSSAMMDGIDEAAEQIDADLRQRADYSAEQLLTDRSEQGALRAARGALALLEQVLSESNPELSSAIAERRAAAELARRSQRVAAGYEESIERGDGLADRAEAAPLPESASELEVRRATATDASREVRITCRVDRRLSVPGL